MDELGATIWNTIDAPSNTTRGNKEVVSNSTSFNDTKGYTCLLSN